MSCFGSSAPITHATPHTLSIECPSAFRGNILPLAAATITNGGVPATETDMPKAGTRWRLRHVQNCRPEPIKTVKASPDWCHIQRVLQGSSDLDPKTCAVGSSGPAQRISRRVPLFHGALVSLRIHMVSNGTVTCWSKTSKPQTSAARHACKLNCNSKLQRSCKTVWIHFGHWIIVGPANITNLVLAKGR